MRAYRRLALQLRMDLADRTGGGVVMFTCPSSAEVSVHMVAELAHFLAADQGHRVLIVDGCLDDPLLSGVLGLDGAEGLADVLADPGFDPNAAIVSDEEEGIDFLPAGRRSREAARALAAGASEAVLTRLREKYDYVLVASGPLTEDPTALALAPCMDCVLVLAVEDATRIEEVERTRQTLAELEAKKIGLVVTSAPRGRLRRRRARS